MSDMAETPQQGITNGERIRQLRQMRRLLTKIAEVAQHAHEEEMPGAARYAARQFNNALLQPGCYRPGWP